MDSETSIPPEPEPYETLEWVFEHSCGKARRGHFFGINTDSGKSATGRTHLVWRMRFKCSLLKCYPNQQLIKMDTRIEVFCHVMLFPFSNQHKVMVFLSRHHCSEYLRQTHHLNSAQLQSTSWWCLRLGWQSLIMLNGYMMNKTVYRKPSKIYFVFRKYATPDDNFFGPMPGVLGTSKQVGIHFNAFLYIWVNLLLQERRCNFLETYSLLDRGILCDVWLHFQRLMTYEFEWNSIAWRHIQ
jgi:hypothetical protein